MIPNEIPTDVVELAKLIDGVESDHGITSPEEEALYRALIAQEGLDKAYSLWVRAGRIVDSVRYGTNSKARR
jgi:hypothetical protein